MGLSPSVSHLRRLALIVLATGFLIVRAGPACAEPGATFATVAAPTPLTDCRGASSQKKAPAESGAASRCAPSCAALAALCITIPEIVAPIAPPPPPTHQVTLSAWHAGPSPPPPRPE